MCHVDRFRPSTLRDSGSAISIIVRKRAGAPADEGLRCARCAGGARCAGCGKRGAVVRAMVARGPSALLRTSRDSTEFGESGRLCHSVFDHATRPPSGNSHERARLVHSGCGRAGAGSANLDGVARFERLGQLGVVIRRRMAALRSRNALGVWS